MCRLLNSIWYIVKSLVIYDNHDANDTNNKLDLSAELVLRIPSETYYVVKETGWVDR